MYTATFFSTVLLSAAAITAAPIYRLRRAGEEKLGDTSTTNVNRVQLSTPIMQTCTVIGFKDDSVPDIECSQFSVNGLVLSNSDVAHQVACMTDETVCLQQGNATDVCDNKRQFCEFQNSGPDGSISLNEDGDFKETPSFFLDPEDPKCKEKEHPLICDEPIDAETGLRQFFRPSSTPSKFVEDNDAGHDLIKTKSGPIGKGFKTLVTDNGNATFTAGNLKTFSRNFALQLGCHFDEADCRKTAKAEGECTAKRVECERANGLIRRSVVITQRKGPSKFTPAGVELPVVDIGVGAT